MGILSCFRWSFSCSEKKQKQQPGATLLSDGSGKSKAVDAKVWPGDDLHYSNQPSSKSSFNDLKKIGFSENQHSADEQHGGGRRTETDVHVVEEAGGDQSAMDYVQEWVRTLQELPSDDIQFDLEGKHGPAEKDSSSASKDAVQVETTDPAQQLNALVLQSLNTHLTSANLSRIGLKSVPTLAHFMNLKDLCISANSIVKIPTGCFPRNLQCLDLSRNKISTIEGLRGLDRLRILNLSHNRISRIGHGLGNCPSIRELYLRNNKISTVEGLHRLSNLFLLDLSNNSLSTTKSLMQLAANYHSLQILTLLGNPVVVNLGDDQLRRLVTAIAPHLTHLNNQIIKPALLGGGGGKFARIEARDFNPTRKSRRFSGSSKAKRVVSLQAHSRKSSKGRIKHF